MAEQVNRFKLDLQYCQCRDGILRGSHPVSKEIAVELGALQCQVQYGDFPEKFNVEGRDFLPKEYAKEENENCVVLMYKELIGTNQHDAMLNYVNKCRELRTYGVYFFLVKELLPGQNRLVPRLFGINEESVMICRERRKEILKVWPLEEIRRWAKSPRTLTLDLGDNVNGFYTVHTLDGEIIAQLIGAYIDIIVKKRQLI